MVYMEGIGVQRTIEFNVTNGMGYNSSSSARCLQLRLAEMELANPSNRQGMSRVTYQTISDLKRLVENPLIQDGRLKTPEELAIALMIYQLGKRDASALLMNDVPNKLPGLLDPAYFGKKYIKNSCVL